MILNENEGHSNWYQKERPEDELWCNQKRQKEWRKRNSKLRTGTKGRGRKMAKPNEVERTEEIYKYSQMKWFVCLLVGCLTSQQHASVSQGRICSDNFTCCHTETEAADQTFHLTQSQYTDTGPTSPSADPIKPGAWQGSHWSANFQLTGMTRP